MKKRLFEINIIYLSIYINKSKIVIIEDERDQFINSSIKLNDYSNTIKQHFYTEEKNENELLNILINKITSLLNKQETEEREKELLNRLKKYDCLFYVNEIDFFNNIEKFIFNKKINDKLTEKKETTTKKIKI